MTTAKWLQNVKEWKDDNEGEEENAIMKLMMIIMMNDILHSFKVTGQL